MRRYSASIDINATAERIWAIITDTTSYPSFDPTCVRIQGGKAALNVRLRIFDTFRGERALNMRITMFSPPRLMVWAGGKYFGLVKRIRSFTIEELAPGRCRFSLEETLTGPALPPIGQSLPDMTEAFAGFCAGLKELAEAV